jgi:hypothetical protein
VQGPRDCASVPECLGKEVSPKCTSLAPAASPVWGFPDPLCVHCTLAQRPPALSAVGQHPTSESLCADLSAKSHSPPPGVGPELISQPIQEAAERLVPFPVLKGLIPGGRGEGGPNNVYTDK